MSRRRVPNDKEVFKFPPKDPLKEPIFKYMKKYYPEAFEFWIESFPETDKKVLKLRLGLYDGIIHQKKVIKELLDISTEKISRIEAKAKKDLRNLLDFGY
jgi:DNA-directed RNA polymerase sigma subunit (sigma70/sigma32)|tara:strand:+ start:970 stop:1269 length:300 start_codon:yes stop_codon:yes gene_type:complete